MKLADKITQAAIFGQSAIKAHKTEYAGIDAPDYFQGATCYGTIYDEVFTGIGDTPQEAYQDACEGASEMFDTAYLPATARLGANGETVARYYKENGIEDEEGEMYCYVLLYVQTA
jgi:hypothetical protein